MATIREKLNESIQNKVYTFEELKPTIKNTILTNIIEEGSNWNKFDIKWAQYHFIFKQSIYFHAVQSGSITMFYLPMNIDFTKEQLYEWLTSEGLVYDSGQNIFRVQL